jgi:hypothetical protein
MIIPVKFLADVQIELAEEYAFEKVSSTILAMSAYMKYRNLENVAGMKRCDAFLDEEDKRFAIEKMVEGNLEKMLREPLKLEGDIKRRLADPIEREKLKDEVKTYYRDNFIFKYLGE